MITTSRFLGYDKNEYGDLIVNRKEAEIVSLTFDLYLLNVGSSRIGELLDYLGVKTVTGTTWAVSYTHLKKGKGNKQLHVFTFRQIQENVIHQSTSMAISSLLILAALCCFGAGVGIAAVSYTHLDVYKRQV